MKKILIVIDLQNDFTAELGALSNPACEEAVARAARYIEGYKGDLVLLTQDTHNENYERTLEGKNLPVRHCIKGSWGWEINDIIKDALSRLKRTRDVPFSVVEKNTFGFTGWNNLLNGKIESDTEIEIIGVCTGICVVANAVLLRALYPNTTIKVIANLCACVSPSSHHSALEVMKMQQIDVE